MRIFGFLFLSLVLAFFLSAANLIVATWWYNTKDQSLIEIADRFASGETGDMACGDMGIDENGHVIPARCTGGILAQRDAYLDRSNVAQIGRWNRGQWSNISTFSLYFKYGW